MAQFMSTSPGLPLASPVQQVFAIVFFVLSHSFCLPWRGSWAHLLVLALQLSWQDCARIVCLCVQVWHAGVPEDQPLPLVGALVVAHGTLYVKL